MVGMNERAKRRQGATSKLLAGTAAVAEGGIVEQGAAAAPLATDPTVPASEMVPAPPAGTEPSDAAVLPDPTLTREPYASAPIVTASPVLAAEPSATDVVQAEAKADRIAAGLEPAADRSEPHDAVAGQPTLAIERSRGRDVFGGERSAAGVTLRLGDEPGVGPRLSLDALVDELELLSLRDPGGMEVIRQRFFAMSPEMSTSSAGRSPVTGSARVAVVEISGPPKGRRRAGLSFGSQPRRFLASALGVETVSSLRADPLLAVSVIEVDEDDLAAVPLDLAPADAATL